ncbi:MAG: TAXI family TRAP transporter solute-binding subunit [Polynucleobacter sp.]
MGSIKQDIQETALGLLDGVRDGWNDFCQFIREAWPLLALLFLGLAGIWWYADPPPPRHVLMATGSTGGSYEILGKKYAAFFEKKGITLELVHTQGAQENIQRLSDRKDPLQAAFVQAGVFNPHGIAGVASLGSVDYEPIWFFYRGPVIRASDYEDVNGRLKYFFDKRISVGIEGSGTHTQALRLMEVSGFKASNHFLYMSAHESVDALKKGQIDGAFLVDGFQSKNVQTLLADPSLNLTTFRRAEAYARMLPYLHILKVPTGGFSLVRNFPDHDIQLLATTTNLLIDDRMHPALQFLFLEAAREINGKASFFADRGEFPFFGATGIPESPVALHYEKNGSPLLMAYIPFWLAELINRLVFVFLPFCAIAYPLLLTLPGYRMKRMRRKIDRLYGVLKTYEYELIANYDDSVRNDYLKKLDLLEYEALNLEVPKVMSGDYYALRTSIDYVRNCLNRGVHPYQIRPADVDVVVAP